MCDDVSNRHRAKVTGPAIVADCGCNVPPWEDCEHTEVAAQQALFEITGLSLVTP